QTGASLSSSGFQFTPPGAGTYTLYFNVTDHFGIKASSSVHLTVDAHPSVTISSSPNPASVDVGQSISFASSSVGGSGSYVYQWYVNGSQISGATSSTYSLTPGSVKWSGATIYLVVTDSLGVSQKSNTITITVFADPTVSVVTQTVNYDVGQSSSSIPNAASVTYSGSSTHSSDYSASSDQVYVEWFSSSSSTFTYSSSATPVGYGTSFTPPVGTSASTTYYFAVVVDTNVHNYESQSSGYIEVVVSADPTVSVTPSGPISLDVSQSQSLTASVTYTGKNTITVTWYSNSQDSTSGGTSTGQTGLSFSVPTTASYVGTTYYYAVVSDNGVSGYSSPSNVVEVTVNAGMSSSSIVIGASPGAIDSGSTAQLAVSSAKLTGTSPYSGQWYEEAPGTSSFTALGSSFSWSSSLAADGVTTGPLDVVGTWQFNLTVTDSSGESAKSNTVTVTVNALPAVSISSSPSSVNGGLSIDIGTQVTFTAQVSGGTSGFSYAWFVNGTGTPLSGGKSIGTNSPTLSLKPESTSWSGAIFYVVITDASGNQATSNGITLTVNSGPTVTLSPSSSSIDVGQSAVTLTATPSGGSGTYSSYAWYYESPGSQTFTSISGASSSTYSFSSSSSIYTTTGTYSFEVTVTDSYGMTSPDSTAVTVTVYADPTVSVVTQTVNYDVGQSSSSIPNAASVTYSGSSTHSSDYSASSDQVYVEWFSSSSSTFTYSSSATPVGYGTSFTPPVGTSASTTYYFAVVVDTNVHNYESQSSGYIEVAVDSAISEKLTPSATSIDVGQSITFSNTTTGGSGSYKYSWAVSPSAGWVQGKSPGTYDTFNFTSPGTYRVWLNVTDSNGGTVSSESVITVNSLPAVSLIPSITTMDAGQSVSFTNTTNGGTGSLTYTWSVSPSTGWSQGSTQSTYNTFTFTSPGTYTVTLTVKDSLSFTASATATVNVDSLPNVAISPSSVVLNLGSYAVFTAVVDSGTGPYATISTYEWQLGTASNPSGSAIGTSNTLNLTTGSSGIISATGTYYLWVTVKDEYGESASSSAVVTVSNIKVSVTSQSSSTATIDLGQSVILTGTFSGGTAPYQYEWSVQQTDVASVPTAGFVGGTSPQYYTFTPLGSGTYYVFIYVKDSNGGVGYSFGTVHVNPKISVGISASRSVIDATQAVTFTNTTVGGTAPYKFSYSVTTSTGGSASGDYSISGNSITFTSPGSYNVALTVTDSASNSQVSQPVSITVNPILKVSLTASSTTVDVNNPVAFSNTTTGGTAPLKYAWAVTLNGSSTTAYSQSLNSFIFTKSGTYMVYLNVTDGTGYVASSSSKITVNNSPSIILQSLTVSISGPSTISVNSPVSLKVTSVTGGSGPYTGSVLALPPGSTIYANFGSTFQFTTTPATVSTPTITSAGTWLFEIEVYETSNPTAYGYSLPVSVYVTSALTSSAIVIAPTTVDVNGQVIASVQSGYGVPPFSYSWSATPSTGWNSLGDEITFTQSGQYTATVTITDSSGQSASQTATINVVGGPSISITPSSTNTDAGLSVTFSNVTTGGEAPYHFSYSVVPVLLLSGTASGSYAVNGNSITFVYPGELVSR
ncbi:MAG: PKD domain-containing protein, partial [Candidatus Thermoplasmatota archaeon]|nr:PKD domain-containing protein [Candidatus Thermoplasmatota archaeon]